MNERHRTLKIEQHESKDKFDKNLITKNQVNFFGA